MGRLADRATGRVRASWRLPPAAALGETLAWAVVLGAALFGPARATGLVAAPEAWGGSWWMPLRVMVTPALIEELAFRVVPNPHPREDASPSTVRWAAAASLTVYVGSHLVTAWLRPPARDAMLDPVFLAGATALGAAAWILYRRWGSLLPPVALHALVVGAWLYAGGADVLA